VPILRAQIMDDPRWFALMGFIGCRLDDIGRGISVNSEEFRDKISQEQDDWEEGYLTALKEIVLFIQCLQPVAAA
jgi:hypothetical protein